MSQQIIATQKAYIQKILYIIANYSDNTIIIAKLHRKKKIN